jgi:hypothetical protein
MSRVKKEGVKYMVAYGVDRVTSAYVQVWQQPHEEQDGAVITIDNRGVMVQNDFIPDSKTDKFLENVRARFTFSRNHGNERPNIDEEVIARLARCVGVELSEMEVYRVLHG